MKERHFLSKNVLCKNTVGYLRNGECYSFQTLAIVFSTPENLSVGIYGALGMTKRHFLLKNVFQNMQWGMSETVNARAFKPLPLCSDPLTTY